MSDNIQLKDGLGNVFTMRTRDVGSIGAPLHIPTHTLFDQYGQPILTPTNPAKFAFADVVLTQSFARPADTSAYAIGDLIANSTTAGSVVPMLFQAVNSNANYCRLLRGRLFKSTANVALAVFRSHFYNKAPTLTNGDNGSWQSDGAAHYVGSMDFDMTGTEVRTFTDGPWVPSTVVSGKTMVFNADTTSINLVALLEARAAYVPASAEVFNLTLELSMN